MGAPKHFFGEDGAWVYSTMNIVNIGLFGLDDVADGAVVEVCMDHTFGAGTFGIVNGILVVVVERSGRRHIREVHFISVVAEREDLLDGFIGGVDFCFAGGAAGAFLADGLPCNRTAAAHDEEAAHRVILPEFDIPRVRGGFSSLTAPVRVTESLDLCVGWWGGPIRVGLTIMDRRVVKVG